MIQELIIAGEFRRTTFLVPDKVGQRSTFLVPKEGHEGIPCLDDLAIMKDVTI